MLDSAKKKLLELKKFLICHKNKILFIYIIAFLSYFIKIVNYSVSIDTEKTINLYSINDTFWISIGRWSVVFFGKFFQYFHKFNPIISNLLIPLFLTIFATILSYLIIKIINKENLNNKVILTIGAIIVTSPMIAEMMGFTMMAAEVALGLIILALALYFSYKAVYENIKIYYLISIILLTIAFGFYQAFFPLYMGIIALVFFIDKVKNNLNRKFKDDLLIIIKMMLIFAISYILWKLGTVILMNLYNLNESNYLNNQINWGKISNSETIEIIKEFIKGVIFPSKSSSVYNHSYLIIIIFSLIYSIRLLIKEKSKAIIPILCLIFILVSPFFICILTGNIVAIRTLMSIPVIIAILLVFMISETKNKKINILLILIISLISLSQYKMTSDLFYSDYIRYEEDKQFTQDVFTKIDLLDELREESRENRKIVFVGAKSSKFPGVISKGDTLGFSFYEWDMGSNLKNNDRIYNFAKNLGYNYIMPTESDVEKAYKMSKDMGVYPVKSSIQIKEELIIVRLT